jgi:hypothetical protein
MKKGYVLGLLAVFVIFASLGSQCQKVTDPAGDMMTGYSNPEYAPPFNAADFENHAACEGACGQYYADMLQEESETHSETMADLKGNDPVVKQLRQNEILRHKDEVDNIKEAREECRRLCHDQGGVSGGF